MTCSGEVPVITVPRFALPVIRHTPRPPSGVRGHEGQALREQCEEHVAEFASVGERAPKVAQPRARGCFDLSDDDLEKLLLERGAKRTA